MRFQMTQDKMQEGKKKREVIHLNCYKLFLCNLELKYIFEEATDEEILNYNSSDFLIFYVENLNISFCLLSSILIWGKEEFSVTKFVNNFMEGGENKSKVIEILQSTEFQMAWKRIRTLRDKCYAHNDKTESEIKKEIQLTQNERNVVTEGLIKSLGLIYGETGDYVASFEQGHSAGLKRQLKIMKEWREYYLKDVNEQMNAHKKGKTL
jgi:hypothetical protein